MAAPPLRGLTSAPDADWERTIDFIEEGHGPMPGWSGVINRPNIRRILECLDSLDRPELYAHEMEERAKKQRRGKPSECELEAEAAAAGEPPVESSVPAEEPSEPSKPAEPPAAPAPGQES